jgi:hypothetical protein
MSNKKKTFQITVTLVKDVDVTKAADLIDQSIFGAVLRKKIDASTLTDEWDSYTLVIVDKDNPEARFEACSLSEPVITQKPGGEGN